MVRRDRFSFLDDPDDRYGPAAAAPHADEAADAVDADTADQDEPDVPGRRRGRSAGGRRRATPIAIGLLAAMVVYYLVSLLQVVLAARGDDPEPVDAIVVLGAAQYDGRPSPQLAARLDHVVELWDDGVAPLVVVTGGKLEGDRFTEAEASRDYLVDHGVPQEVIAGEASGHTTFESLANLPVALDGLDVERIIIVTDGYHALRSRLIAEQQGFDVLVSPTPTSVVTGWTAFKRELGEAGGVALGRIIGFERLSELTG